MAFVTAVRDYIDFLNSSFDAFGAGMSMPQIIQQTALYVVESCRIALFYIVTLQWLRDFTYLPIIIPKYTARIYQEALVLVGDPSVNIFTFGETPTILQNKFFVGFFNSIFACLPFSCAQLIALRRFYLQGWPVAFATSLGIIAGQVFFLTSVLFGWRALLFPWLHFEPWNYILGFLLITSIVYSFSRPAGVAQHRNFTLNDLRVYLSMGCVAFILTLCEQGVIFQHITTFTVGLEPSFMEPLTGTSQNLVLAHSIYILGFLFGSLVFTSLSYGAAFGFRFIITQVCLITEVRFHMYYQQYSRYLIMGIAATTVPFYGLDYYVTNPLGFVPYDTAIDRGSFFTPNSFLDTWFKEGKGEVIATVYPYNDYPLAGFDRGIYFFYKEGQINADSRRPDTWLTDEDHMLPVENAWRSDTMRQKRYRRDLMRNQRAALKRIKTWLRKIAPALAEAEQKRLKELQQKRAGRVNRDAVALARRAERNNQWVPEQFNQFKILDNYTFSTDRYKLRSLSKPLQGVIRDSRQLINKVKKSGFKEKDFEKIDAMDNVMHAVEHHQNTQRNAIQVKKHPSLIRVKTRNNAPRYSLRQNFEELVQREMMTDKVQARKHRGNYYYLYLWQAMNTFLPEDVQYKRLEDFQVPFRGRRHRRADRRFRNNIFYKTLMRTDIDAFLTRQPKHHLLTPTEEAELYFKRTMLSDYYNSMRRYKNMQNSRRFLLAYGGTKSLAHKVYNHQFKGTYRTAQRLFSVDLRPGNHPGFPETRKRVLKYDQPLYDETKSHNPMLHEELQKRRERVTKRLKRETKRSQKERAYQAHRILRAKGLPFFRATNSRPFYCGWDEGKRQFVLTNRYTPRIEAGSKTVKNPIARKKGRKRTVKFTSWPIRKPSDTLIDNNLRGIFPTNQLNRLDYKNKYDKALGRLFNPRKPVQRYSAIYSIPNRTGLRPWRNFREWPEQIKTRQWYTTLDWWQNDCPPTPFADRGGFVWPGHRKLQVNYLPQEIKDALDKKPQTLLVEAAKILRDKATAFFT